MSLKETAKVLGYVDEARRKGASVIIITHNLSHAWQVSAGSWSSFTGGRGTRFARMKWTWTTSADLINTGRRNGGEGLASAAVA